MNKLSAGMLVIVVGLCAMSAPSMAENPLGFYVGAGVGESDVRSDRSPFGYPGDFDEHHAAWKVSVGVRPLSLFGAELEYIDFGSPNSYDDYFGTQDEHAKAGAAFALGYLPLPLPLLDVFGKAGVARLQSGPFASNPCYSTAAGCGSFSLRDYTSTRFAYGAGVQTKFFGVGLRAEYERISASGGDPDFLSVGATWTF